MEDVFLVVCSWREASEDVPDIIGNNIVILKRPRVEDLYSPSLTSRPQFVLQDMFTQAQSLAKQAMGGIGGDDDDEDGDRDEAEVEVEKTQRTGGGKRKRTGASTGAKKDEEKRKEKEKKSKK